jgi:hypothetical protein
MKKTSLTLLVLLCTFAGWIVARVFDPSHLDHQRELHRRLGA